MLIILYFEDLLINNGYDSEGLDDDQILRCDAESVLQLNLTNFEQSAINNGFNSYNGVFVTTEANQAGGIRVLDEPARRRNRPRNSDAEGTGLPKLGFNPLHKR